ncbi:MAG TPA: ABC transporter substrate-binding protein, partial [SAR324 cluster bacterium]|nr:ABC transporter substrate-binding protein [SAR324 cluster bacterium]
MIDFSKFVEFHGLKKWAALLVMFSVLFLPSQVFAEAGVEPRRIVLGSHQPLSGPMKTYSQVGRGALIYFQYLNDQGGIHGRQLVLLQRDDRFQPQRTLEVGEKLVMKDRVFALFSGIG